jgi:hypothetical protein
MFIDVGRDFVESVPENKAVIQLKSVIFPDKY